MSLLIRIIDLQLIIESGGSILADFADGKGTLSENIELHGAVRSKQQAESLAPLKAHVLQADLGDGGKIESYVRENDSKLNKVLEM